MWNVEATKRQFMINICTCYSCEIALKISLNTSFDNMWDCKGLWKKIREVNDTKAYITNDETFHLILNGCYTNFSRYMYPYI
jgi:hypothetical protein